MALDKLVDSTQLDSDLGDVADAIRAKSGGSSQLAFPSGFISEIGNINTGGAAEALLASGSYTVSTAASTVTIPVSYSGTATRYLVIKDVEDDSVAEMIWWARANVSESQFPSNMGGQIRTQCYKTAANVKSFAGADLLRLPDANSIAILRSSATYNINPGTYSWYIWGYAT